MAATGDELREAGTPSTSADRIAVLSAHEDVRVRVLCAKHPNLSKVTTRQLAGDAKPNVRLTLARRGDLTDELAVRLAGDASEKVRAEVVKNHEFSRDQLVDLVQRRRSSLVLIERLKTHLKDPAFTAELFALPQWKSFACSGTFRHSDVKKLLKERNWAWISQVSANATLQARSLLLLARAKHRGPQQAVGMRLDLSTLTRLLILLIGRQWAAAAVLETAPRHLGWRSLAALRHQRVITRARAVTTRNRFLLARLSLSRRWDILQAVACNTRTTRATMKCLCRRDEWAPQAALAARRDLPDGIMERLVTHPAVVLEMLVNPNTPAHVATSIRYRDPILRHLASIHPSLPLEARLKVSNDGDAPAWLLRRLASDPALSEAERERILTWLALGGGTGDINFDPVTCVGTPGTSEESHLDAYRAVARGSELYTALWRSRVLHGQGKGSLGFRDIATMASDAHPAVRQVAAGYRSKESLQQLLLDPSPVVSAQAQRTLETAPPGTIVSPSTRRWRVRKGSLTSALVVALAITALGQLVHTGNTPPDDPFTVVSQLTSPDEGVWTDGVFIPTDAKRVCHSGGVDVYMDQKPDSIQVTLVSSTKEVSVTGHVDSFDGYHEVPTHTVPVGLPVAWMQRGTNLTIVLSIGDDPDETLSYSGSAGQVWVLDPQGDC